MRPRLLNPHRIEFALLNTKRTRADDPDGTGPLTGGYDDDFKEILNFTDAGGRHETRQDDTVVVPCQIEMETFEALNQKGPGNDPNTSFTVVAARKDLERMGLIDCDTGWCKIRVNDKLVSIRNHCGKSVFTPREPFYITQVAELWGLSRDLPDLVRFTIANREQFVAGGG